MSQLPVEWIGNLLNILCVWLIWRNNPWNWLVGILNCLMYIWLFVPNKLYADAGLQVVYILLALWGGYYWLKGKQGSPAPIKSILPLYWGGIAQVVLVLWSGLSMILLNTDTDVPYADAGLTALCLMATWLMSMRYLQHWFLWIAANLGYFFLYNHKGLYVTMWFQIPLMCLSFLGYIQWKNELKSVA